MANYHLSMTKELHKLFNKSKGGLGPAEQEKFKRVIDLMMQNPFHPSIHRGPIRGAIDPKVYHSEVGKLRLIWRLIDGGEIILAYLGEHDPANNWAKRHRIDLNPDGLVCIKDVLNLPAPVREEKGLLAHSGGNRDNIFRHCTDEELVALEVPKDYIPTLRGMKELENLRSIEGTVPQDVFDKLYEKALEVVEIPPAPTDAQLRASLERFGGGEELVRFVNSEEFKRALKGSMEDWMLFLAPRQRRLVYTNYNGPARVKGVAGSGKTVVAVHRARIMAQRNVKNRDRERILFLTYGNRLPDVNRRLLQRLTNNGPERKVIECRSIYSWVRSLLLNQNIQIKVGKQEQLKACLQQAIAEVRPQYPEQHLLWRQPPNFFQDEIGYHIKGRGMLTEAAYLSLPRTGRGTPLQENARRAMFAVFTAYQKYLQQAGIIDWQDLILLALQHVDPAKHPCTYVGAVVDEIQDLTEATLKLIRKMVAPGPDDLFLVGDGTQRIYKGGFSLNQIGIQVRGRESVLRFNYRNTREIMRLASAIIQGARIDDMDDDEIIEAPEPEETVRSGETPVLRVLNSHNHARQASASSELEEVRDIAGEIHDLKRKHGYEDNDFAILVRNRKPYFDLVQAELGYPVVALDQTDDNGSMASKLFGPGVKLVTMHSAKGLEFKVVFILGASDEIIPYFHAANRNMPPEDRLAHIEQERRLLYVAVTRARDFLYITCPGTRRGVTRFLRNISEDVLCRLDS